MLDKLPRVFATIYRYVVGGESWSSAWEAIKGEIGEDLPSVAGFVSAGLTLIGTLVGDVSWAGVAALTFCAFVAGRQLIIQQGTGRNSGGQGPPPSPMAPEPSPKVETAEERQAKLELAKFVAERVIPACEAQRALQNAIIRKLCQSAPQIEEIARAGIDQVGPVPGLTAMWKKLGQAVKNPTSVSLEDLMAMIKALQDEIYTGYCSMSAGLCRNSGFDHRADEETALLYLEWKESNDRLEADYERFRRDHRFPLLVDVQPKRHGQAFTAWP